MGQVRLRQILSEIRSQTEYEIQIFILLKTLEAIHWL